MLEKILSFLFGTKCPSCGVRSHRERYTYTRAWNHLCEQAAGEYGYYCMECHFIEFDTPDFKAWLATQPKWIAPYGQPPTGYGRKA